MHYEPLYIIVCIQTWKDINISGSVHSLSLGGMVVRIVMGGNHFVPVLQGEGFIYLALGKEGRDHQFYQNEMMAYHPADKTWYTE